ncbi:MAG: hypothetical protein JW837_11540, partial [Sedimentisphaerales bacterium]|nr:hypothetical protein [Sedimentisphaerales bacterium]
ENPAMNRGAKYKGKHNKIKSQKLRCTVRHLKADKIDEVFQTDVRTDSSITLRFTQDDVSVNL